MPPAARVVVVPLQRRRLPATSEDNRGRLNMDAPKDRIMMNDNETKVQKDKEERTSDHTKTTKDLCQINGQRGEESLKRFQTRSSSVPRIYVRRR